MYIRFGDWLFRPGRASTVGVLLVLPFLLALGFWQLDRAQQKAQLQEAFAERFQQPPVALQEIDTSDPANRYRRVSVIGRYDSRHQFLLDNQVRDSQPGYHVLTPLHPREGTAILINRGWLPLGTSRQALPDIMIREESVAVTGWLGQPANPGLRWGEATGGNQTWPRILPYVTYQELAELLGYSLQPAMILLDPESPAGYGRDWQPRFGGSGPERHRGYAVQWFALAAALIMLYVAANTERFPRPKSL
ncbi:MAG: SURF1 family protein [Candidatus Competibacter denitrificans]